MADVAHFFDLDRDQLRTLLAGCDMPSFRADQVLDWVYRKQVADPTQMSNLSKDDRDKLGLLLRFTVGSIVRHQVATDGVQKLLMQWDADREQGTGDRGQETGRVTASVRSMSLMTDASLDPRRQTECVMIPVDEDAREKGNDDRQRNSPSPQPSPPRTGARGPERRPATGHERGSERRTACISSQVGCPVGCRFCASGLGGLDGDLTAGQIVEQVWRLGTLQGVGRISNVVFMGMGEPLANFNNVARAIRTLNADWGLGISARRITISTVGLPAQMRRLAELELPVTLAISLHAPNDVIRRQLIPWANYVTIEQLLDAGRYYFEKTGREITLEYILLGGVNDQPEHARQLVSISRSLRANVNLIRYNEVKGLPFDRPHTEDVLKFQSVLRNAKVNVHIRASRGRDIAAACGQLRHEQGAPLRA